MQKCQLNVTLFSFKFVLIVYLHIWNSQFYFFFAAKDKNYSRRDSNSRKKWQGLWNYLQPSQHQSFFERATSRRKHQEKHEHFGLMAEFCSWETMAR